MLAQNYPILLQKNTFQSVWVPVTAADPKESKEFMLVAWITFFALTVNMLYLAIMIEKSRDYIPLTCTLSINCRKLDSVEMSSDQSSASCKIELDDQILKELWLFIFIFVTSNSFIRIVLLYWLKKSTNFEIHILCEL